MSPFCRLFPDKSVSAKWCVQGLNWEVWSGHHQELELELETDVTIH